MTGRQIIVMHSIDLAFVPEWQEGSLEKASEKTALSVQYAFLSNKNNVLLHLNRSRIFMSRTKYAITGLPKKSDGCH